MPFEGRGHHLRKEVCKVHRKTHYYNAGQGQRIQIDEYGIIRVTNYAVCECGQKGNITSSEYKDKKAKWYKNYLEDLKGEKEVVNEWR